MGESSSSTCLLRSYSQPSTFHDSAKEEGDPLRALTSSISFGRFVSENLNWEKWSSFTKNRYLEEVEKCSKPGSVAEMKAFFEARYKKFPAKRPVPLLQHQVTAEATTVEIHNDSSVQLDCAQEEIVVDVEETSKDNCGAVLITSADANDCSLTVEGRNQENCQTEATEHPAEQACVTINHVEMPHQIENWEQDEKMDYIFKDAAILGNLDSSDNKKSETPSIESETYDRASEVLVPVIPIPPAPPKINIATPTKNEVPKIPVSVLPKPPAPTKITFATSTKKKVPKNPVSVLTKPPSPPKVNTSTPGNKITASNLVERKKWASKPHHIASMKSTTPIKSKNPCDATPNAKKTARQSAEIKGSTLTPQNVDLIRPTRRAKSKTSDQISPAGKVIAKDLMDRKRSTPKLLPVTPGVPPTPSRTSGHATPNARKSTRSLIDKQRSTPNSLHMSINFSSHAPGTTNNRSPPVIQKVVNSKVVRMLTRASEDKRVHATPTKKVQQSVNVKHPLANPQQERRSKTLMGHSISETRPADEKSQLPCMSHSKPTSIPKSGARSSIMHSPFSFKSEERAAKRKEAS